MGWETANIHLGTPSARRLILRHVDKQKGKWLHEATGLCSQPFEPIGRSGRKRATPDC